MTINIFALKGPKADTCLCFRVCKKADVRMTRFKFKMHLCDFFTNIVYIKVISKCFHCLKKIRKKADLSYSNAQTAHAKNPYVFVEQFHQDTISVCFIHPYTPLLYSKTGAYRGVHYFLSFFSKNMKIVKTIQLKLVIFAAVKNCCILHRHVFVEQFAAYVSDKISKSCKHIMQTRPCNIQQYFTAVKMFIFR